MVSSLSCIPVKTCDLSINRRGVSPLRPRARRLTILSPDVKGRMAQKRPTATIFTGEGHRRIYQHALCAHQKCHPGTVRSASPRERCNGASLFKLVLACSKFVQTRIGTTGLSSPYQVPCGTGAHFLYGSGKHGSAYFFCLNAVNTRPNVARKTAQNSSTKSTHLNRQYRKGQVLLFPRGLSPSPPERVGPGRRMYSQLSVLMRTCCARTCPRLTSAYFTPQKMGTSDANPA